MGSHGYGALGNLVMGSVATQVLANSKAPVLLVPVRIGQQGREIRTHRPGRAGKVGPKAQPHRRRHRIAV